MTVDEIRSLVAAGKRLSDEAVLKGLENLAGEHLGRLSESLVADQLPRALNRVRLVRRNLAAAGEKPSDAAVEAAKADLRLLRAHAAFAAAPREAGARAGREFKELVDAVVNPLIASPTTAGLDDLVVFLEALYAYGFYHFHVARARRRSELRRKRREGEDGGGRPARPEGKGERRRDQGGGGGQGQGEGGEKAGGERGERGDRGPRGDRPRRRDRDRNRPPRDRNQPAGEGAAPFGEGTPGAEGGAAPSPAPDAAPAPAPAPAAPSTPDTPPTA
jgi:hypothetical protein